ncbi:efflux RND transporter periplasmic adaptor subunit [Stenotrophomonas sp. SY1]|jgi:multidrug efflux system membrane fusion protein|uniref:efflux RND transporter periplasmic adaptor subunit n=1 Tax=Stenotrophomonas sp. SY1 TaxID=477235 RepID=UPI001E5FF617|nr:efflux RND transporter periplasmic adaptor subunit [Stenotrophomonas sp. SY1]MCD9088090.1 efflux RND transporter periplasmic adaptor subunit [Stenotrophomonas sp. SY1]
MTNVRWIGCGLLLALLAACGKTETAPAYAVPVFVEHPAGGIGKSVTAYPGEVRAREEAALSFRVGGKLLRREVDAGQRVSKGQLLAVLDAADFELQARAAQAQYAAAEADLVRARDEHKRYAALAAQQLVSRSALDAQTAALKAAQGQADAARATLDVNRNQADYAQLHAPEAGMIASREAEAGQVVAAGQTIYTLAADGAREVAIALPESDIRDFSVGQAVEVELWNQAGKHLPGSIREIAAAADPQTRTYAARISLAPEALNEVELGQSARVFISHGKGNALSVPLAAVQPGKQGQQASVWVVNPANGTLQARAVTLGTYGAETVPVLQGLKGDEWVVAAGGHLLREGQQVTAVDRANRPVLAPASAAKKGE